MEDQRENNDGHVVMYSAPLPAVELSPLDDTKQVQWQPKLVVESLLIPKAKNNFADNILNIYTFWLNIAHKTTLPRNITCTDPSVKAAFEALDQIIDHEQYQLQRIAYAALSSFMSFLQGVIAIDRKHGRIHTTVGYRNASVALDIYVAAQTRDGAPAAIRAKLNRRLRLARRWTCLRGSTPL